MDVRLYTRVGVVFVACLLATGCATGDKDRMAGLEGRNKSLEDELARARAALTDRNRALQDAEARRLAAEQDANALRGQLASLPAPEQAPPGWTAVPGGAMTSIEENLLFPSGKAALRPEARKTLDQLVSTLTSQYPDKDILVFGHTDNQPIRKSGWDDNWQLSTERALAVVRFLGEHGIEHARLLAAGAGEHWPRAKNDSDANRQRNRRVEIYALDRSLLHGPKP